MPRTYRKATVKTDERTNPNYNEPATLIADAEKLDALQERIDQGPAKDSIYGQGFQPNNKANERRAVATINKRANTAQQLLDQMAEAINRPDILRAMRGETNITAAQQGLAVLANKIRLGDLRTWKFVMEYLVGTPVQRSISLNAHADASTLDWLAELRGAAAGDSGSTDDSQMAYLDGEASYIDEVREDALS